MSLLRHQPLDPEINAALRLAGRHPRPADVGSVPTLLASRFTRGQRAMLLLIGLATVPTHVPHVEYPFGMLLDLALGASGDLRLAVFVLAGAIAVLATRSRESSAR